MSHPVHFYSYSHSHSQINLHIVHSPKVKGGGEVRVCMVQVWGSAKKAGQRGKTRGQGLYYCSAGKRSVRLGLFCRSRG